MDLKDPKRWDPEKKSLAERRALASTGERMCSAWRTYCMTICAIEGHCIGGGAALAVRPNLRVIAASHGSGCRKSPSASRSLGRAAAPVRLLGPAKAKRFIILCERYTGREAVDFGLAEYLAADGHAYAEALKLAAHIAELPEMPVK